MKKLYILLPLLTTILICSAQSKLKLTQQWSFDSYGSELGMGGLVTKDLDHDGRAEIIVSGVTASANFYDQWGFFSVISFNPASQTYETKWTSRVFFHKLTELEVFDFDNDGHDEIFLGFDNGEINVINTTTYTVDHVFYAHRIKPTFSSNLAISSLSFGDIDNDGTDNVIATSGDSTYIYDATFKLKRKFLFKGGKITLANVDLDPEIETIYSLGHVVQFSGAERKVELKFFPSSNNPGVVRIADMNKDGVQDVAYASADSIHVIDVRAKKRIRSIAQEDGYGVSNFQLHDYTLDGVPDFFVGDAQLSPLSVHDGLTTQIDYTLQDPKYYGVDYLTIANLDDEPGEELLWTSGANCTCSDHLFVFDMNSHEMKWMSKNRNVTSFEVADLNASPGNELIIGSIGSYLEYFDHGFLSSLNLSEKDGLKLDIDNPISSHHIDGFTSIRVGDIDDDGKKEILVGVENSYAFTMIFVYDEEFNHLRTLDVWGMSYIADIEIVDIDDDNKTEIIVTSGTNVSGSTHPDEYKNYIYIFDGKTGAVKWKSEQLGGLSSRIGNILVGNIDSDPAKEIVALRYLTYSPTPVPAVHVIDGWTYNVKTNESLDYNALDLADFDHDGIDDIIAGTISGRIVVLDGQTFAIKKELAAGKNKITSLHAIDINGDQSEEYIFTNQYKLHVLDAVHSRIAETDTLNYFTGLYNTVSVSDPGGPNAEILVNARHTLFSFKLDSVPNTIPSPFDLLTPVNHASIPSPDWIEFSWETPADDDDLLYAFTLSGNGVDTALTNIRQTHLVMPAAMFMEGATYSWSVLATDNFEERESETFTFKVTNEVILAIDENIPEKDLSIYPNPFHSDFIIQNESEYNIDRIVITDRNGQQHLMRDVMIPARSKLTIEEVSDLPSGIYLCSMRWNGSTKHTVKIAKY